MLTTLGVLIFDIKTGCQISKMEGKTRINSFTIHEESIYWLDWSTNLLSIYSMKTKVLEEYILQVRDWGDWIGVINGDIFLQYQRKYVGAYLVHCTRMHGRLEEREPFLSPKEPLLTLDGYILSKSGPKVTLISLEGRRIFYQRFDFSVNKMCVWNKEIWFCNSSTICLAKLN